MAVNGIQTFSNPWNQRHAALPGISKPQGFSGEVNPHNVSVGEIDPGGTSHILNEVARRAASPSGRSLSGEAPKMGSPIVGDGMKLPALSRPARAQRVKDGQQPQWGLPSRSYRTWTETIPQTDQSVRLALPGHQLADTVAGRPRPALPAGEFPSASGGYVPPFGPDHPNFGPLVRLASTMTADSKGVITPTRIFSPGDLPEGL